MGDNRSRDYYEDLEVSPRACDAVIKAAHRVLVQLHHPDKVTDPVAKAAAEERTKALNSARDELLDPSKRAAYDLQRAQERRQRPGPNQPPPNPNPPPGGHRGGQPGGGAAGLRCDKCGRTFRTAGGLEWHRTNFRNCA